MIRDPDHFGWILALVVAPITVVSAYGAVAGILLAALTWTIYLRVHGNAY